LSLRQSLAQPITGSHFILIHFKLASFNVNGGELTIVARLKRRTNPLVVKLIPAPSEFLFAVTTLDGCHDRIPEHPSKF
jgi:hypothetical protein